MPNYSELVALGGAWVYPIGALAALSLFGTLWLTLRARASGRVSPLAWVLMPSATYALGLCARFEGHRTLGNTLVSLPPDQVEGAALSGLAIALLPECLAAHHLVPVLLVGALLAGLVSLWVQVPEQDDQRQSNPRMALRLIALAQLVCAALLWWRGTRVWVESQLYDAFVSGAPEQRTEVVSEGFVQFAAVDQWWVVAFFGLLAAPVLLYEAGRRLVQAGPAWGAPALVLALFALASQVQAYGGSYSLDDLSMSAVSVDALEPVEPDGSP